MLREGRALLIWSGSLHESPCVHVNRSCFLMCNLLWHLQGQKQKQGLPVPASSAKPLLWILKKGCFKKRGFWWLWQWSVPNRDILHTWCTRHLCDPGIKRWCIYFKLTHRSGLEDRCRLCWNASSLLFVLSLHHKFMHYLPGFPDIFMRH